jgi:hypothetical protein
LETDSPKQKRKSSGQKLKVIHSRRPNN